MTKILLIGYGQWGKALLKLLSRAGNKNITLYTRQKNLDESLQEIVGPNHSIHYTDLLDEALLGHELAIIAKKSQEIGEFLEELGGRKLMACLQTSKGLSSDGKFFSDLLPNYLQGPLGVLYGPNFASEILAGKPSLATLGSKEPQFFLPLLKNQLLQLEVSYDIKGLEVASLLKNIFAIASGIISASLDSDNSQAAFFTRAFRELVLLLDYFGSSLETAHTAAALGDLVLTSYSNKSRNFTFGKNLILGIKDDKTTLEGIRALETLVPLLPSEATICKALFRFLKIDQDLSAFLHQVFGI